MSAIRISTSQSRVQHSAQCRGRQSAENIIQPSAEYSTATVCSAEYRVQHSTVQSTYRTVQSTTQCRAQHSAEYGTAQHKQGRAVQSTTPQNIIPQQSAVRQHCTAQHQYGQRNNQNLVEDPNTTPAPLLTYRIWM